MMHIFFFILAIISSSFGDVSHLANNLQVDGYHYEQPTFPFPSENEIIPQQTLSARNDFNPPAFLLVNTEEPKQPAPQPTPEYIPPAPTPAATNLQVDGYHYEQPSIPFLPKPSLSARNDFNPPAFLLVKPEEPEQPAPEPITDRPTIPTPEYIPPAPSTVATNLQEDGYHYQQPSIPFPSVNEVIPQQQLSARNDFNPPAFLFAKPDEPISQEPITERPAVQIPEVIPTQTIPVFSNLQEDGYHYEQPSIPFVPQQSLSARNDFNPPAFLLTKPEEPAPTPEEPAPTPEEPKPTPEEPAPTPEEPAPTAEEPIPFQPLPEVVIPLEPVTLPPVPEYIPPAPTTPPPPVQTNLQEDGYHYQQPLIPFIQNEPSQQYVPVEKPQPVQQQSTYFDLPGPEPEPSYSLGPNGYNYRVPSRPFRF